MFSLLLVLAADSGAAEAAERNTEIVVTGDRSGEGLPANQIGGSVTIIDAEAIERRQVRDVSDVLRDVPGAAVAGTPGLSQVRLRGTEANHVLVLVDGIEVSDPFFGEFDFSSLLADEASRIEVLRGQQSAIYGSDAIGGVIQYITLSGRESPGTAVRLEGGSFATVTGSARLAGTSRDFDYALNVTGRRTDGAPNTRGGSRDLNANSEAASAKLAWNPADNLRLTGVLRYSRLRSDFNTSDADPASPTFGETVDSPGLYLKNEALYGLLRGELGMLDGRWTHALSAQFADVHRDTFDATGRTSGNRGGRFKSSYDTTIRLGDGAFRHRLTLAADLERESFRDADPTGFAFSGWRHITNKGLVALYELLAGDNVGLGLAVRHDFNSRFADDTTCRLQGSYELPTGTRLRAAAGSGIKNPGIFELFGFVDGQFLGNPDLKPEKSRGWEAGIEQDFAGGRGLVGATYFRNRLHDEIVFAFLPGVGFVGANSDDVSSQRGVETFANLRFGHGWRIDAAYTYLRARQDGAAEVRRPKHVASLAIDWHPPQARWGTTLMARYNGETEDDAFILPPFGSAVRVKLDDYLLLNWNADFRLTDKVELFGRVENILNEHYEQVFSFVSPGRSAYAGVRWRI
jgi:vitamin B12 transporter